MVANFNCGDIRSRIRFLDGTVGEMLNLEACFPAVAEHVAYAYVISELECRRKGAAVIVIDVGDWFATTLYCQQFLLRLRKG